ncbi:protein-tyrosine phosphatase [Paenibacillus cellulosilyticus]|uniref:Protein-tyrosine phosphatase n=1 Tax=Paenibacillus cellulosilyticus TaxID=375489 RepID=A0A2V2YWT2_9BACL|nr:tyrosine-protein phosphatase [Paenibacillus cellulosilyticus]PWW05216.1 protein-tyrosine phosphatase [Paenibacillus cellulosilyticus]QKS43540.1 tyrosine-protein phosphatase [Paenibacillus cellulosilyticus]
MPNQLMPSCLIPLEGAFNFRDMGGYRASDGRSVKRGLLFRAAELTGLTPDDHRQLEAIGLKHVFDYRNRGEAEQKPDPVIGQAINTRVPANEAAEQAPHIDLVEMFQKGLHRHFSSDMLTKMYANLPIGSSSYRELMKLLSSPETNLPLVQHCAGGRDRTGVGSMLILLTLGVPYETVMEDYLLSNITLMSYHQELFDMAAQYISIEELRSFEDAMRLQEKYLDASMDSILREYGSFERYLELEFGIDEAVRARIQDYCLE